MNVPEEPKVARWTANKVMGVVGLLAALTAAGCWAAGAETPGIVAILVVFVVLCWFGLAF